MVVIRTMLPRTDFDAAFAGGHFGEHFVCSPRRLGVARIASGRVAVFDPDDDGEGRDVIVEGIPDGTYPVDVAMVRDARDGREATAAVRIVFTGEPVAQWEAQRATHDGPRPPFEVSGHSVLSGSTVITDASSMGNVRRGEVREMPNAAIVTAGWGERNTTYATYVGRDARGALAALAVDFEVLTTPVYEDVTLELPLPIGRIEDARFDLVGVEAWATSATELELRGDIARICVARVGDPIATRVIEPQIQTRPTFVQRFTFPAIIARAFVRVYVGRASIERR